MGVRNQFRLGGLRSTRISSGFARILHDFLPKNCYLKNYRGAAAPPAPPPPASYAYDTHPLLVDCDPVGGAKPLVALDVADAGLEVAEALGEVDL